MATSEGMEAPAAVQTMDPKTGTVKTEWASQFWGQTIKSLTSPELWAGAVAGFVAGTAVGFTANKLWKAFRKR